MTTRRRHHSYTEEQIETIKALQKDVRERLQYIDQIIESNTDYTKSFAFYFDFLRMEKEVKQLQAKQRELLVNIKTQLDFMESQKSH